MKNPIFEITNHTSSSSSSSSNISRSKNNKNLPNLIKSSSNMKRRTGRKIFKETRHPVYRGVRQRNGCRWVCEVREPNKKSRIWLGTFSSPEMAARAHDVAALALKGQSAQLNFPESASQLPIAQSSSVVDIRKAAFLAATTLDKPYSGEIENVIIENENGSSKFVSQNICLVENNNNQERGSDYLFNIDNNDIEKDAHKNYVIPFLDEEEIFDMPGLINNMAEGMLLTPPAMMKGFNWDDNDDYVDDNIGLSLWMD